MMKILQQLTELSVGEETQQQLIERVTGEEKVAALEGEREEKLFMMKILITYDENLDELIPGELSQDEVINQDENYDIGADEYLFKDILYEGYWYGDGNDIMDIYLKDIKYYSLSGIERLGPYNERQVEEELLLFAEERDDKIFDELIMDKLIQNDEQKHGPINIITGRSIAG
eukprot:100449_1